MRLAPVFFSAAALSCILQTSASTHQGSSEVCTGGTGTDEISALQVHVDMHARTHAHAQTGTGTGTGTGTDDGVPRCSDGRFCPHIILALADDLGWPYAPWNNPLFEPWAPTMMQLASEGVVLDRLYSAPWCTPSRASLLSGRLALHALNQSIEELFDTSFGIPDGMTLLPRKLRDVGYATHAVGKWHLGFSSVSKLPRARGFDTWLGYFSAMEDKYTKLQGSSYRDFWLQSRDYDGPAPQYVGHDGDAAAYGDAQFSKFMTDTLEVHPAQQPVFFYVAFQSPHDPQQVPQDFLEGLPSSQSSQPGQDLGLGAYQQNYVGMVRFLDSVLFNITDVLKRRGMWQHTLFVFSSDHGAVEDNYPLTGQKFNVFEGGVRVAAFASGGLLPAAVRGTRQRGYIHMADWYATACELAGADPLDAAAEANGMPAVDSVSVWPLLSGAAATSPRQEIPLSVGAPKYGEAVISGSYKLIVGDIGGVVRWAPDCSSAHTAGCPAVVRMSCPAGCLYDIIADPEERHDIAAEVPAVRAHLLRRLHALRGTRLVLSGNWTDPASLQSFMSERYGGFLGPWEGLS